MLSPMTRRAKVRGEELTTTVTLPKTLMEQAKIVAIRRGTSFKALVVKALRAELARKEEP
jgi:hypothetical protein